MVTFPCVTILFHFSHFSVSICIHIYKTYTRVPGYSCESDCVCLYLFFFYCFRVLVHLRYTPHMSEYKFSFNIPQRISVLRAKHREIWIMRFNFNKSFFPLLFYLFIIFSFLQHELFFFFIISFAFISKWYNTVWICCEMIVFITCHEHHQRLYLLLFIEVFRFLLRIDAHWNWWLWSCPMNATWLNSVFFFSNSVNSSKVLIRAKSKFSRMTETNCPRIMANFLKAGVFLIWWGPIFKNKTRTC